MNMSFAPPHADEEFLVEFVNAWSEASDRDGLLAEWCRRRPDLADRLRHLATLDRLVGDARPEALPEQPQELGGMRIVRRIAVSMGEVFEAFDPVLNRRVAVKTIRRDRISPEARARFLREREVLAHLHQTRIVPIHAAGEEGPLQYFVMPYIEGASLNHVIAAAHDHETSTPGHQTPPLSKLAEELLGRHPKEPAPTAPGATGWPPSETRTAQPQSEGRPTRATPTEASLRLSEAYFRSVAQTVIDLAEALHHAHQAGFLHRDAKPSNLMIEPTGQCWIIDFGLAGYLDGKTSVAAGLRACPAAEAEPLTRSGILGTPPYMAPEQYRAAEESTGSAMDARTDVWGLGVTLYELLTLRRAFPGQTEEETRTRVLEHEPIPPRRLVRHLPRDLAGICKKAMQKDPDRRYQTAQALADDLRHWLRKEPTSVRRSVPRRMWLWGRRNRALTLTGSVALLLSLALATIAGVYQERAQEGHRQSLIRNAQQIRLHSRKAGWSDGAWQLIKEAAKIRVDLDLRNEASATLVGVDSQPIKRFENVETTSLAFGPKGELLIAGSAKGAMLWDGTINQPINSTQPGACPVVIGSDGTPLQIAKIDYYTYRLWNVRRDEAVTEFKIPVTAPSLLWPYQLLPRMALSPDGLFFAASMILPDGKGTLAVWNGRTGMLMQQFPEKATALAFTPAEEGKQLLLAAGYEDGRIKIWSLPDLKEVAAFQAGRMQVNALAFRQDLRRSVAPRRNTGTTGWLLAVGEAGGRLVVWDLSTRLPLSYCHGSSNDIHAVAFSTDGMALASGGRGYSSLWDVATGRRIMDLDHRSVVPAIAFDSNGRRLATASFFPDQVEVCEIEQGRGTRMLGGLAGRIEQIRISENGQWLAALAHDWELGVWDLDRNRLSHVIEVPRGPFVDNAGFAFNADGTRLAIAGGHMATLWETSSGKLLETWALPPGLGDQVGFHPSGKLLSFRWETEDKKEYPTNLAKWPRHPRVCRIRELKPAKELEIVREIRDFSRHIYGFKATFDGSYLVVEGLRAPEGNPRMVKCFEGLTGKELWPIVSTATYGGSYLTLDPNGRVLTYRPDFDGRTSPLIDIASGKSLGSLSQNWATLGPEAKYWCHGNALYRRHDANPVVTLGIDSQNSALQFSPSGNQVIWGSVDGSVVVCDLEDLNRRLGAIHLDW
jgi:serine/threonine protein kinase/WD40 repeat protein